MIRLTPTEATVLTAILLAAALSPVDREKALSKRAKQSATFRLAYASTRERGLHDHHEITGAGAEAIQVSAREDRAVEIAIREETRQHEERAARKRDTRVLRKAGEMMREENAATRRVS